MIVSTKGRYALRVMIDLAEHQAERYVPLKEVAARQDISEKYLENILKVLVQNGFLEGLRGKGGGYRLTRSPDQYTVAEILLLTEGSLAPVSCLTPGAPACERMANCRTYTMWKGLNDLIADYFGKITLADLAAPEQAGNDYVIRIPRMKTQGCRTAPQRPSYQPRPRRPPFNGSVGRRRIFHVVCFCAGLCGICRTDFHSCKDRH